MSKGELGKGVAIRLIAAVVFGAIGYAVIYCALQMVAIFGEGMGVDARSRELYANSHMIVHLFAAACALAIGIFYFARNWVLFALSLLAIISCGSYGIVNMYGFASANRVSVAAAKDATKVAAEREYKAARADLEAQIKWLQSTASEESGRERRRLLAEVDAKRKELSALKAPAATAETALSDPGASTFGELTGTNQRTWLLTFPMILAILMFFAESFSFVVVGHMLSGAVALIVAYAAGQSKPDTNIQSGSGGSSGGSEPKRRLELVNKTTAPAATTKVSSADASVPASAPPMSAVNIHGTSEYPRRKLTKREAQADLHSRHAASSVLPTQEYLAEQWGVSQATVSRWQAEWEQKRAKGLARVFRRNMHNGGFANAGFTAGRA